MPLDPPSGSRYASPQTSLLFSWQGWNLWDPSEKSVFKLPYILPNYNPVLVIIDHARGKIPPLVRNCTRACPFPPASEHFKHEVILFCSTWVNSNSAYFNQVNFSSLCFECSVFLFRMSRSFPLSFVVPFIAQRGRHIPHIVHPLLGSCSYSWFKERGM